MSFIGRHDPTGSGAAFQIDRRALATVSPDAGWEVDAVPLPITFDDAPTGRAVALLVASEGLVLGVDLVAHPPNEPADVAIAFADAVQKVAAASRWPTTLLVRHPVIVEPLTRAIAERGATGTAVHAESQLPGLDAAIPSLIGQLTGAPELIEETSAFPLVSVPESWLGWELPAPTLASLLAAAADFHRARPWLHLYNSELLTLDVPDDDRASTVTRWTACVLGNGGEQFGLVLYADDDDAMRMFDGHDAGDAFVGLRGAVLTLDFNRRNELPRGMQREFATYGWPVASTDAYPRLWALNTPAGGLTRAQARALTLALDAVARFATAHATLLATHPDPDPPIAWVDDATSVVVTYAGDAVDDDDDWDDALWEPPTLLLPGGAEGPTADPLAGIALGSAPNDADLDAFTKRERAVLDRYAAWLAEGGTGRQPLGTATIRKHVMTAELLLDVVNGTQGASLTAVHELDLRTCLYDFLPRKVRLSRAAAMGMPNSLRRFFHFLAIAEELVCPWASPILLDRESFEARWDAFPGGSWWDAEVQEWQQALWEDLDLRVMLPPPTIADGISWGMTMGMDEARLHGELQRRWLAWRDEVILAGVMEPADVRAACVRRQQAWARAPHPAFGKRSPLAVLRAERTKRA